MRKMYSKKQIEEMAKAVADSEFDSKLPTAKIGASQIDTGEQADGKVMMSDGEGGVKFGDMPSGDEVVAYEGTSLLAEGLQFTNWTLNRAIKIGSMLWIVITGQITNTSESAQTLSNIAEITLPSDIAQKIFKTDGTSIHTGTSGYILGTNGFFNYNVQPLTLTCSGVDKIKLEKVSAISIASGTTANIDIRVPLFIDVGSVE